jgi:hypothetical protein
VHLGVSLGCESKDGFRGAFGELWESFGRAFGELWESFERALRELWESL